MILNPMVDLSWDIYLDWLADQGFDQLREIPIYSLICGYDEGFPYHNVFANGAGAGETEHGDGPVKYVVQFEEITGEGRPMIHQPREGCGRL